MNNFEDLFSRRVKKPLSIISGLPDSSGGQNIDTGVEIISRLYLNDRNGFLALKTDTLNCLKEEQSRGFEPFTVLAYISYIEGHFSRAVSGFKQALKYRPDDQAAWLYLAFSYRQLGQDDAFERIVLKLYG